MSVGRRVQAVNRFGSDHDSGIKSETGIGAIQVVVDGLGHAHAGNSRFDEGRGHRLGIVTAERDDGIQVVRLKILDALLNATRYFADIGPRRMQDGSAEGDDAVDSLQVEWHGPVFEHAAPPLEEADEFVAVNDHALLHDRCDHSVQARAVSATRKNANAHGKSSVKKIS